jgi:sugar phosphate isomerase/epimerase
MTTRRQFIYQSAVLAAAAVIDTNEHHKKQKKASIQLYTVREEVAKNLENAVAKVAEAGYGQLELYGYNPAERNYFGRTSEAFAQLLKKNNLTAPSGHYLLADMLYEESYNWDSWKYALEAAKKMGHQYVIIPWLDEKHRDPASYKRVAERLNKGGELSKAMGITTGYHNHQFEFDKINDNETGFDYLLKNTDPSLVCFEMDIYWVYYAKQNAIDLFKKYPKRFPLWHVKDMEAPTAEKSLGQSCEVGSGIINFKEVFAHKKLAGLKIPFVEQEAYRKPVFDCIKTSADYMKKNFL